MFIQKDISACVGVTTIIDGDVEMNMEYMSFSFAGQSIRGAGYVSGDVLQHLPDQQ